MSEYKTIDRTKQFENDYSRIVRTGESVADIDEVLEKLAQGKTLAKKYRDHKLDGEMKGSRDVHIRGDLILLYSRGKKRSKITFIRLGTHNQLFT